MIKIVLVTLLVGTVWGASAQMPLPQSASRQGFVFGASVGVSAIRLSHPGLPLQSEYSVSFPNFKFGYMLNPRTALLIYLPGSVYTYTYEGRVRDRGFEGIVPSVQYWLKPRWWVMGGAGLGMDAPTFYDVRNESEGRFYFGTTGLASMGYEIYQRGRMTIDVQARTQLATKRIDEALQKGIAHSLLIGINFN